MLHNNYSVPRGIRALNFKERTTTNVSNHIYGGMNTTYPHIIDTYLLKTKNNRPTNNKKTIMSKSTKVEGRKKRLFSLRLKMNACRKANREAVINEAKLLQDKNVNRRKRQEDYEYLVKTWKDAMDHVGIKDGESYLVEPAFEAHRKLSKKKIKAAKANNNFGWNQFNADAMYKGHEKRVKAAFSKRRKSNNGNAISSSGLDRMAEEVKERKAIRANFSRRRQQYDEEDVNYINQHYIF